MLSISGLKVVALVGKTSSGNSYYYFEHKAKSRIDMKILMLNDMLGGYAGYALYFSSLEVMVELESPFIRKNEKIYAISLGLSIEEYNKFIDSAITCGLFDITENGDVFSPAFMKWFNKKASAKLSGQKGGKKSAEMRAANE